MSRFPVGHLSIPHLPGSLNEVKRHWRLRMAENARWRILVATYAQAQGTEKVQGPVEVWIRFHWKDRTRRDPDNYVKSLLDALVKAQLIEDDGPPVLVALHLESRWDPAFPRVEIVTTPADAPAWPVPERRPKPKAMAA